jgi:hypothetical protein
VKITLCSRGYQTVKKSLCLSLALALYHCWAHTHDTALSTSLIARNPFWANSNGGTAVITISKRTFQKPTVILRTFVLLVRTGDGTHLSASDDTAATAPTTTTYTNRYGVSLPTRLQLSSGGCEAGADGSVDERFGGSGDLVQTIFPEGQCGERVLVSEKLSDNGVVGIPIESRMYDNEGV